MKPRENKPQSDKDGRDERRGVVHLKCELLQFAVSDTTPVLEIPYIEAMVNGPPACMSAHWDE